MCDRHKVCDLKKHWKVVNHRLCSSFKMLPGLSYQWHLWPSPRCDCSILVSGRVWDPHTSYSNAQQMCSESEYQVTAFIYRLPHFFMCEKMQSPDITFSNKVKWLHFQSTANSNATQSQDTAVASSTGDKWGLIQSAKEMSDGKFVQIKKWECCILI